MAESYERMNALRQRLGIDGTVDHTTEHMPQILDVLEEMATRLPVRAKPGRSKVRKRAASSRRS